MAIYKLDEIVYGGSCELPKDRYTVRVVSATKKTSKEKGNPMAVIQVEIIAPEKVLVEGQEHSIAGRKFTFNAMLNPTESWGLGKFVEGLKKAGFDFQKFGADGDLDDDKLPVLAGFCFDMVLGSKQRFAERAPTAAEKAAGKKDYVQITMPDGKPIPQGYEVTGDMGTVAGPASVDPTNPY